MDNRTQNILVIDDIMDNLKVVTELLSFNGYEISIALSGEKALEIVEFNKPDLILLDVSMPVMNGFEVCRRLKDNPETEDIPIIFLTAMGDNDNVLKGFELGAVDYVVKPFYYDELSSRVNTHLELKRAKDLIKDQNSSLKQQNEELRAFAIKQQEHKAIMEKQARKLEKISFDVNSSIEYASRIQKSVQPPENFIDKFFKENFILNMPKDVVSGDFYWFRKVKEKLLLTVVDCTGHGIPGALMSIMGISALNNITHDLDVTTAGDILDSLRNKIKDTFSQYYSGIQISEGMDMCVCIIDLENNGTGNYQMQYAGARNPLYIVRKEIDSNAVQLITLKADRMPVSIYLKETPFQTTIFQLEKNDKVYLFSDGYYDQPGGEDGKRLKSSGFGDKLVAIYDCPMADQKNILKSDFKRWIEKSQERGLYYQQVDDIMVIGFQV